MSLEISNQQKTKVFSLTKSCTFVEYKK